MYRALSILAGLGIGLTANAELPGDSAVGKKLHDTHCVKCHDASVYTRKDRKMSSVEALKLQLGSCSHAAQVILTDEEQQHIVKYLNERYYKFK